MANQQPQQALCGFPPTARKPRYRSCPGLCFAPRGRGLVADFLATKAIRGRLPDGLPQEAVADGVDVYGSRPEALPFRNRGKHGKVWGHFFETRAASGSGGDSSRAVPGAGSWQRYGEEKAYATADGDVFASRRRLAFYGEDGKLTPWRMKEFRLNERAAAFRGVALHPAAKNLVACKVYNEVEEPPSDQGSSDDEDDEAEAMEVDGEPELAAPACTEDDDPTEQQQKKKPKLRW